jgi:prolycopene isomerase
MEEFRKSVIRAVPGSDKPVNDFMKICEESYQAFSYLGGTSSPSPGVLFRKYGNFLRTGAAVTDEVADAVKLPQKARDLIYPYWCYLGTSTDKVSFSLWASMVYSYLNFGAYIPDKKSHSIAVAFVREIRKAGGQIRCNAEVEKLLTHNRQIDGVTLRSGETIRCNHVISNISPHHVYGNLIDPSEVPARASRMVNARTPGVSFFVVYLGLDADRESLGLTDYSYFIAPHMDTDRLAEGFGNRHNPDPMQATVCLNAADESASPPGTTILSISAATTPEAWKDVNPWNYHRAKEEFAELLIRQFEKATGTEIRSHIEEIETASPATFSRYTAAWNGTVYGYEATPWDGIIPRILADKKESYFKGLYFCGGNASRTYGFGSSMLSGKTAAGKAVSEMGR